MPEVLEAPLQLYSFGGLNTRDSNFLVDLSECVDMENIWFDSNSGSALKRSGRIKYNAASLGASKTLGGHRAYQTGGRFFYVAHNGVIYNGAAGVFSSIATGLNTSARYEFETFRNMTIGCNGQDRPRKLIGTVVTIAGADAPSVPTLAIGSGSGLTGVYQYKIAWKTDTAESNGSTAQSITLANQSCLLTRPAVPAGFGITHWRIYRSLADAAVFFFVADVAEATATYDDSATDAAINTNAIIEEIKAPPPQTADMCVRHQERMFYWGVTGAKDTLYYSEVGFPEYVQAANAIRTMNGESIVNCKPLFGNLIIYTPNSMQVLTGDGTSGNEYTIDFINPIIGCIARRSLVSVENKHFFLSRSLGLKVYAYDGSGMPVPISDSVQPDIEAMATGQIPNACAVYYRRSYLLCYANTGSAANDRILGIDLYWTERKGKQQWFRWLSQSFDWIVVWTGENDAGELYAGSVSAGQVWRLDQGTDDDGTNITFKIFSKYQDFGVPEFRKRYRRMYLYIATTTGNIDVIFDVDDTVVTETVTIAATGAQWDVAQWDVDKWASSQRLVFDISLPDTLVGRTLQVRIQSTVANQLVRIEGYSVRWYLERNY